MTNTPRTDVWQLVVGLAVIALSAVTALGWIGGREGGRTPLPWGSMQRRIQASTRRHRPTGGGAPSRPGVGSGRRLLRATLTVGLLTTLWFAWLERAWVSDIRPVIAGLVAIGLIAGLVARSWWTAALAPAVIVGLSSLLRAASCARGCPPTPEDTPFVLFMLQVINAGIPAALGAAGGALLAKALVRYRRK